MCSIVVWQLTNLADSLPVAWTPQASDGERMLKWSEIAAFGSVVKFPPVAQRDDGTALIRTVAQFADYYSPYRLWKSCPIGEQECFSMSIKGKDFMPLVVKTSCLSFLFTRSGFKCEILDIRSL